MKYKTAVEFISVLLGAANYLTMMSVINGSDSLCKLANELGEC